MLLLRSDRPAGLPTEPLPGGDHAFAVVLGRTLERAMGAARASHGDGYGLGLSIVGAIAAAHYADLQARARPEGGLHIGVSFAATTRPSELDGAAHAPIAAAPHAAAAAGARSQLQ